MSKKHKFIPSGSTLLDCALSGGFSLGHIATIAGWQSSGKTLVAIETMANFANLFPDGKIRYLDSESAFDEEYALKLGLPTDRVGFVFASTVEGFSENLDDFIMTKPKDVQGLFVLDSLDALSTLKEQETKLADIGGFGAEKAKLIGIALRKIVEKLKEFNVTLIIVQQLRDNLTGYGGSSKSGGKALRFYAYQELMLKKAKVLEKVIDKISKPYGIEMHFKVDKNKAGKPFREAEFNVLFGYGIDNTTSCVKFLRDANKLIALPKEFIMGVKDKLLERDSTIVERIESGTEKEVKTNRQLLSEITTNVWNEIELMHDITRVGKY